MKIKEKCRKLIITAMTAVLSVSMTIPYMTINADSSQGIEKIEYSEEFNQYIEDIKNGNEDKYEGRIPAPYDLEGAKVDGNASDIKRYSSVKYDPRQNGKTTPAKDQGNLGICWAFAGLSGMESYLATNGYGSYDLSEEHMRWWARSGENNWKLDDHTGSSNFVSMSYLASGEGPKFEKDIPYKESNKRPENYNTAKGIGYTAEDLVMVPNDMKSMKNAILKYGAVVSGYYDDYDYSSSDENAYYIDYNAGQNHAIAIVGWDDNYSRNNFDGDAKPRKDGAWLIKNSWGNYNDEDGFVWISYEDKTLRDAPDNYAVKSIRKNGGEKIYQHENGGYSAYGANKFTVANVFNFNRVNETIEGITVENLVANSKYEIYYAGVKNGVPQLNTKKKIASGVFRDAGYITVPINSFSIPSGKGAIVLTLTAPNNKPYAAIRAEENSEGAPWFKAKAARGESFIVESGKVKDMNGPGKTPVNFVLKAVTKSRVSPDDIIGSNRYETAVKTSKKGWSSANTAVISNGSAIVDALTATPLASYKNAPILLTEKSSLKSVTRDELKRLGVKNVYIVGGTSVVDVNVENQLKSMGISVKRIYGKDRYATGVAIANEMKKSGANIDEAAVVNGVTGLADAISFGAAAGERNIPIILSDKKGNIPGADSILKEADKTYIIGGTAVVPKSVEAKVENPERISGKNRSDTNAKIISRFYPSSKYRYAYVVKDGSNGTDQLIDGLSVGVLAAKTNSPIVLAGNSLSVSQKNVLSSKEIDKVVQVGGGQNFIVANQIRNK